MYRWIYKYYTYQRYKYLKDIANLKERKVDLGGHHFSVFYRLGSGSPILFLHGLLDACYGFRRLLSHLEVTNPIYLMDIPGFGKSKVPPMKYLYQIPIFADLIYATIQELGLKHITLLGHSMGGLIAQHICLRDNTQSIQKLILVASGGTPHPERDKMRDILFPQTEENVIRLLDYLFYQDVPQPNGLEKKILMQAWNSFGYQSLTANTLADEKKVFIGNKASMIQVPTLILAGEHDEITSPVMMQEMKAYIPNSTMKLIPKAKHAIHIEQPKLLAEEIIRFL
ncbi:MAG: alpha/beta hydrolase [Spirochaetota bacterium]